MIKKNTEKDILNLAIEALKEHIDLQGEIEINGQQPNLNEKADYILQMDIQGQRYRFAADVKANFTEAHKNLAQIRKMEVRHPYLLIAGHVNELMAERLKQAGIQFIDAAGNAYLNQPPLYILIKG